MHRLRIIPNNLYLIELTSFIYIFIPNCSYLFYRILSDTRGIFIIQHTQPNTSNTLFWSIIFIHGNILWGSRVERRRININHHNCHNFFTVSLLASYLSSTYFFELSAILSVLGSGLLLFSIGSRFCSAMGTFLAISGNYWGNVNAIIFN